MKIRKGIQKLRQDFCYEFLHDCSFLGDCILYNALQNKQISIEFEFKFWYGCRWAVAASNPDATTYKPEFGVKERLIKLVE